VSETALLDRLRARGWRLTAQRRAVAEALAGDHVHASADQVFAGARRIVPEISLATVYNTLNELVTMGEVTELRLAGTSTLYDPNTTVVHHHLVCRGCGAVLDVHPIGVDTVSLPRRERHGYTVDDVEVVFRGLCPSCNGSS
jgi:Fur family transcriptional regulator, stress-responsive regulator